MVALHYEVTIGYNPKVRVAGFATRVTEVVETAGGHKVRKMPCRPRSRASSNLLQLYSRRNAWTNLHILAQPVLTPSSLEVAGGGARAPAGGGAGAAGRGGAGSEP